MSADLAPVAATTDAAVDALRDGCLASLPLNDPARNRVLRAAAEAKHALSVMITATTARVDELALEAAEREANRGA